MLVRGDAVQKALCGVLAYFGELPVKALAAPDAPILDAFQEGAQERTLAALHFSRSDLAAVDLGNLTEIVVEANGTKRTWLLTRREDDGFSPFVILHLELA